MNNILTIKEKIQKYQEKIKDLEEERKKQIMKEEELIKKICFNTLVKSSRKNTTILDLLINNMEEKEVKKVKIFFSETLNVKFTTP